MYEDCDIYTRMQYREYQQVAKKDALLDPKRRYNYLKHKKEEDRRIELARKYERSIRSCIY